MDRNVKLRLTVCCIIVFTSVNVCTLLTIPHIGAGHKPVEEYWVYQPLCTVSVLFQACPESGPEQSWNRSELEQIRAGADQSWSRSELEQMYIYPYNILQYVWHPAINHCICSVTAGSVLMRRLRFLGRKDGQCTQCTGIV